LLGLKRHGSRTLEALLAIVTIKPATLAWRTRFTRLLVTRLKLARLPRLVLSWLMLSRLMLSWRTRLARLEFTLFAGLRIWSARSLFARLLFTRLIFARLTWLEIAVIPRRTWAALIALIALIAGLISLFARLVFALRLLFFAVTGGGVEIPVFGLGLALAERRFTVALILISFRLIKATKAGIGNSELFLGRRNQTEIMLGVLEKTLSRDVVAGCLSVTTKLHVFFGNALRSASYFNIRAI
jgi:hypothetical protein